MTTDRDVTADVALPDVVEPSEVAERQSEPQLEPQSDGAEARAAQEPDVAGAQAESAPEPVTDLPRALEAILMVADEPQSIVSLATTVGRPVSAVKQAIAALVRDYDGLMGGPKRGFELREVGGGWRLYVREEYDRIVTDHVLTQNPSRLSQAALETLAVIAYRQPITRSQVASIRAVNVDSVVRTLAGRGLITELFTDSETGAINYGTTDLLLEQLGINTIDELPPISPLLTDGTEGFDSDIR
ncbi:SMC-Scp complex subunit ScpB [Okibacterium fritillariae]|uniref:Segregation and condensation protein B n=1 Tax=Okibacterium fritillariae TaxID=123320 RepID=A0A1T5JUW9_9MICO|nr:SMC-Scp complex subunit ScpB [Okibacterium fritillariae]SKC54968.1 segregation and condensation protein B [Okibacterium fritillariae]